MSTIDIINLTPHGISFFNDDNEIVLSIPPSGVVARLSTEIIQVGMVNDIPVRQTFFGRIEGLPEPEDGKVYLVSSLVAQAAKDRDDVYIPNESVRDDSGRIIGCRSLGRIS